MGQSSAGLPASAEVCHTGGSGVTSARQGGMGRPLAVKQKWEIIKARMQSSRWGRERERCGHVLNVPGYAGSSEERKKEMEKKITVKYDFLQ